MKQIPEQALRLISVEKHATSEFITWLDSDLLILDAPDQLILKEKEDFVPCAPDKIGATTGPEDPFESYWQEVCNLVGLDIENLLWIETEQEKARIRLYWNSGVFTYRRSIEFSNYYLQTCIQLFDARIASQETGIF